MVLVQVTLFVHHWDSLTPRFWRQEFPLELCIGLHRTWLPRDRTSRSRSELQSQTFCSGSDNCCQFGFDTTQGQNSHRFGRRFHKLSTSRLLQQWTFSYKYTQQNLRRQKLQYYSPAESIGICRPFASMWQCDGRLFWEQWDPQCVVKPFSASILLLSTRGLACPHQGNWTSPHNTVLLHWEGHPPLRNSLISLALRPPVSSVPGVATPRAWVSAWVSPRALQGAGNVLLVCRVLNSPLFYPRTDCPRLGRLGPRVTTFAHFVCTSSQRMIQNKSAQSRSVSSAPVTREQSQIMKAICLPRRKPVLFLGFLILETDLTS